MKSQTLHLIVEKPTKKHLIFSIGLSIAIGNTAIILPGNAQGYSQESYLPPEVIPVNQSFTYSASPTANLSGNNLPMSQMTQQQTLQTPQEARKALYDAWAASNIFPQSNNQSSYNEMNSPMANNYQNNPSIQQSQTLSGAVNTPSTSQQRTTGGISHAAGVVAGSGLNGYAASGIRSTGGIYSAGLLGAGLMNYGLRNGFRF